MQGEHQMTGIADYRMIGNQSTHYCEKDRLRSLSHTVNKYGKTSEITPTHSACNHPQINICFYFNIGALCRKELGGVTTEV